MPTTIKNNELNIAAILMDKKYDTKLWSCIFGDVYLKNINDKDNIIVMHHGIETKFLHNGKIWADGEVCLFPSKKMQDWGKFAWKKGDVLVYTDGEEPYYVIFESFQDDGYTAFKSRCNYSGSNYWLQFNCQSSTNHFAKASDEEAKEFIKKVEEHYGGKLNLETLQIEKPKQEFKDGDIVYLNDGNNKFIFIFKYENVNHIRRYVSFCLTINKLYIGKDGCLSRRRIKTIRPATDSEKQKLFDALAKEGKVWNPDTKQVEDLPKKCEFKPFDKVLVRNNGDYDDGVWKADIFSHYDADNVYPYACVGDYWKECIPYNDSTKHLLGTTDPF